MLPETRNPYGVKSKLKKENRTWQIKDGDVTEKIIDEKEALLQRLQLELETEKFEYSIFSWNYGIKTRDLLGQPPTFIVAKIDFRVENMLKKYEEVTGIKDRLAIEIEPGELILIYELTSVYGTFVVGREVNGAS